MVAKLERIFLALGRFFFKYRNGLFPVFCLGLLAFTRPGLLWGNAQLDKYTSALGVLLALAGQAFRILVIGFAYIVRGGRGGKVYAEDLVQSGFYAHTRNPMYVGNYLIVTGIALLYGSIWVCAIALPLFAVIYLSIIKNEETYLQEKFGQEYHDYAARVNRFLPNFKGLRHSLQQYNYDWKKVLRKEYGTIALLLTSILALLIWKALTVAEVAGGNGKAGTLALGFVPIALFYGTVRFLKKTGRLG